SARRPARATRQPGGPVAADDDGAGSGEGLSARDHSPADLLQPLLARARHRLDRNLQHRLPARSERMSTLEPDDREDVAPGDEPEESAGHFVRNANLGLGFSVILTLAAFVAVSTHIIYAPAVGVALVVLAIAQMGVHLVFFLHVTTGPDNTNNVLALAF